MVRFTNKESEVNNLLVEESYKAVCQEVCNILKKAMRDYAYGNGTIEVVKGANKALVFLESRGIGEKKS